MNNGECKDSWLLKVRRICDSLGLTLKQDIYVASSKAEITLQTMRPREYEQDDGGSVYKT